MDEKGQTTVDQSKDYQQYSLPLGTDVTLPTRFWCHSHEVATDMHLNSHFCCLRVHEHLHVPEA